MSALALAQKLTNVILDILAHATPLGANEDGFVEAGYVVSVGAIHRAMGAVGHTVPPANDAENYVVAMHIPLGPRRILTEEQAQELAKSLIASVKAQQGAI